MNANAHLAGLSLLLAACLSVTQVRATEPRTSPAGIVIDCASPGLPSQREVGEMAGQSNFSQVYATRSRVMAEARRACKRAGTTKVLVQQMPKTRNDTVAARSPAR